MAESKKEVKKVSLYFDPKIGKKNWRIEYMHSEDSVQMIRYSNRSNDTEENPDTSRKSGGSFFSNFIDKIKQKLTLNDVSMDSMN